MTESNLHFRVIQNKLTAELPKYLDIAKEELDYGWNIEVPHSQGTYYILPIHFTVHNLKANTK